MRGDYFETNVLRSIIVNTGAVLSFPGPGKVRDVEGRGGTIVEGGDVETLRMLDGTTFAASINWNGSAASSYFTWVHQTLELNNCNLNVFVDADALIEPGQEFQITARHSAPSASGTFNGLPEGARFILGGHVFTVTYQGGPIGNAISLIADTPFVWDGGGSGNVLGTPSNWEWDLAPIPGSALTFPANVSKLGLINAFDPGTAFRSLTFTGPSYLLVGNSFHLTEGIYNDVASGDTTISADFVASGNFTSRVGSASRLLLEGSVTGSATWNKMGTGTLRFTGALSNSQFAVLVREGELELDKPSGVNAISRALEIGDGINDVRATLLGAHQIADGAFVTIHNRARLDLNGNDETIDQLQGDGTVSLDGRFVPGRSGRLTVSNGVFSGSIVGDGRLTKAGSSFSTLSLSGHSTFSGLTTLSGGTLFVEGTQTNSPIRLDAGLLGGRGHVGTITGNLGGVVQPGFGGAAFQNRLDSRSVAFNSATTFRPLLTSSNPGFETGYLQVTGTVSLGGCVLSVDLFGQFKPTNGASFLILDNDGTDPIVGTFGGLPEGAIFGGEGLPFRISYVGGTGNDVVITRVAAPATTLGAITRLGNGQMRIDGLGINGVVYPIQAASNLNPVIFWTTVGNGTGDASGLFRFIDTGASNRPKRFYRAVSP
jgi:autotransporter-associated beta strand protein